MFKQSKLIKLINFVQPQDKKQKLSQYKRENAQVYSSVIHYYGSENDQKQKSEKYERQQKLIKTSLTKTILLCNFQCLNQITITNSKLDNIEFVSFLNAPKLKFLILASNHISNLQPSSKSMSLSKIMALHLSQNHFQQIRSLQRIDFPVDQLFSFVLQMGNSDLTKIQDLSKLVKLKPKFISRLVIESPERIKQEKIMKQLEQKFYIKREKSLFEYRVDIVTEYQDHGRW